MNCTQWTLGVEEDSENDYDQHRDVDGDLELEESSDVMIDVSSPHHSLDGGLEVIIGQDKITSISGGSAS